MMPHPYRDIARDQPPPVAEGKWVEKTLREVLLEVLHVCEGVSGTSLNIAWLKPKIHAAIKQEIAEREFFRKRVVEHCAEWLIEHDFESAAQALLNVEWKK